MITPVVKEISRDQALALQREWQRAAAGSSTGGTGGSSPSSSAKS